MLLTIDVGNTNINFGVFKGKVLSRKFRIAVNEYNAPRLKKRLKSSCFSGAILSSVAPPVSKRLYKDLKKEINGDFLVLGKNVAVPIKNRYRDPAQAGLDRLVNAYASSFIYRVPAIILSFGTALTIDAVSANKEFLGGMILPGLSTAFGSLNSKTWLLPKLKPIKPREFIGRDTKSCMASGIFYGYGALCDGLIGQIKEKIGGNPVVVATGGDVKLIAGFVKQINKIDPDLTLKGLSMIYRQHLLKEKSVVY